MRSLYHFWEGGGNMESDFLRADELAKILGTSKSTAYRLMRKIRAELDAQGLLTIAGTVPRNYTLQRLGVNAK